MDDSFEAGFMFAIHVFRTFTEDVTDEDLAKRLAEIRDGERTLHPSPPDATAGIEAQTGAPLPDKLRNSVDRLLGNRTTFREEERAKAARILAMMGYDRGTNLNPRHFPGILGERKNRHQAPALTLS